MEALQQQPQVAHPYCRPQFQVQAPPDPYCYPLPPYCQGISSSLGLLKLLQGRLHASLDRKTNGQDGRLGEVNVTHAPCVITDEAQRAANEAKKATFESF
jgi:hypothetical protein